jgi:hypothetical protein
LAVGDRAAAEVVELSLGAMSGAAAWRPAAGLTGPMGSDKSITSGASSAQLWNYKLVAFKLPTLFFTYSCRRTDTPRGLWMQTRGHRHVPFEEDLDARISSGKKSKSAGMQIKNQGAMMDWSAKCQALRGHDQQVSFAIANYMACEYR